MGAGIIFNCSVTVHLEREQQLLFPRLQPVHLTLSQLYPSSHRMRLALQVFHIQADIRTPLVDYDQVLHMHLVEVRNQVPWVVDRIHHVVPEGPADLL